MNVSFFKGSWSAVDEGILSKDKVLHPWSKLCKLKYEINAPTGLFKKTGRIYFFREDKSQTGFEFFGEFAENEYSICKETILLGLDVGKIITNESLELLKKLGAENFLKSYNYYNALRKEGIADLSTEYSAKKAEIIAKRNNILTTDIKDFWSYGEKVVSAADRKQKEENLRHARQIVERANAVINRYSELKAHNKTLAMIQDIVDSLYQTAGESARAANRFIDNMPKKVDWAILGGLTSGVVGSLAGVAAAVDTQRKNAEIEKMQVDMATASAYVNANADSLKNIAKRLEATMREVEIKVVEENNDKFFPYIRFGNPRVYIYDNGSFSISVDVSQLPGAKVYGERDAYVDGIVAAKMYQGGNLVGQALVTLPLCGADTYAEILDGDDRRSIPKENPMFHFMNRTAHGLCTEEKAAQDAPYQIDFEPYHVWGIEQWKKPLTW